MFFGNTVSEIVILTRRILVSRFLFRTHTYLNPHLRTGAIKYFRISQYIF